MASLEAHLEAVCVNKLHSDETPSGQSESTPSCPSSVFGRESWDAVLAAVEWSDAASSVISASVASSSASTGSSARRGSGVPVASSSAGPPLLRTGPCLTLREAGRRHGRAAALRIRAFMETAEISLARTFVDSEGVAGPGAEALADLRAENAAAFPKHAEEIEGIAEGAGVPVLDIWLVNLLAEVQALMGLPIGKRVERCSDVMLRGEAGSLWHGHNEDWTEDQRIHDSIYFVAYDAAKGADFVPVMGMCYPGMIPGFAMTWADNGLLLTQNSLFPPAARRRGLGCTFVARTALEEGTLERAILRLVAPGQALGCNVNLVALPSSRGNVACPLRACNVEVHGAGDTSAVRWLGMDPGNTLLHFNVYSSLAVGNSNNPRNSSARQARATALLVGAPRSEGGAADVAAVLGDSTTATAFPIFRRSTMVSWLLDVEAGSVKVWAAHGRPGKSAPLYDWDLFNFFGQSQSCADRARNHCPSCGSSSFTIPVDPQVSAPSRLRSVGEKQPLPVQRGMHKVDLCLRQEVAKLMPDVLRTSRNPETAMAEVSIIRKELLRQVRLGTLTDGAALRSFRLRVRRLVQVWPLGSLDEVIDAASSASVAGTTATSEHEHVAGKTPTSDCKIHEVDLLLRKEVGNILRSENVSGRRAAASTALLALRQDCMRQVRAGVLQDGSRAAILEIFRRRAAAELGYSVEEQFSETKPRCMSDSSDYSLYSSNTEPQDFLDT